MGERINTTISADVFARELVSAWQINGEGQRIYREAYDEANQENAEYAGHDDIWDRMDQGERLQEVGDKKAEDVNVRADAANVDMNDVIYLAQQYYN